VDHDELTAYVAARRPRLVRTAVLLGCPVADAEDLVQTTLARVFRAWRRVARADDPDAYVNRILLNCLYDARRRRWNAEIPSATIPSAEAHSPDLAQGLVVRRALEVLSREHREVLVLRFFADLSEASTALALGVPPGTVKSRTSRALAALSSDPDIASLSIERRPG